ncbi:RNA-binding protein [Niallia circulans]|uniref:ASCH/PUA domain-containing protein n=1 Tax=Niallia circulans TaxID=1397 RepID=UPI000BA72852|nr:ASCH/PUA domain-containing protein [Niallia circulans]PAD85461.1 RNA-binding protein [Niallia circulans]
MVIHHLKIQPEYFDSVSKGIKSFEIRKNDRNYKVGDVLLLQVYIPSEMKFTGRVLDRKITYITDYAQHEGYVVMGIK